MRARSESGTAVNNYYTPGKNCRPLSCDTTVLSGDVSVKPEKSAEKVTQSDLIIIEPEKGHGTTSEKVITANVKREKIPRESKLRSRLSFLSSSPRRNKSKVYAENFLTFDVYGA